MVRPVAVALSPHLDDAVFSAGGTLARLAARGWHVVVATVFTRSVASPDGFALRCQLDKGLAADVDYMALRRDEDAAACRLIGAEPRWLDFAEAPHRGYEDATALFGDVRPDDDVGRSIRPALLRLLDALRPRLLLAPQAIGAHVDHVVAVDALRSLDRAEPCLAWHDFPYVSRDAAPKRPFAHLFAAAAEHAVPIDLAGKRRACEAYASQLGFQFGGADGLAARLAATGGVERFASAPSAAPDVVPLDLVLAPA